VLHFESVSVECELCLDKVYVAGCFRVLQGVAACCSVCSLRVTSLFVSSTR